MSAATLLLYPELHRVAPERRARLLERARHEPFDWIELAGLGLAIVAVAWLAGRIAAAAPSLAGEPVASALVAIPLVLVFAGPFYWRRTRRALSNEIARDALDSREAAP